MYMHVYMQYQFMKEEAVDFMEGGKGPLGVFEESEAGRSVIIILPQRKKNHGQQSSKDAKGERERGKDTGSGKMATVVRKHPSLNLNAP